MHDKDGSPPDIAARTNQGASLPSAGGFLGPDQNPEAQQGIAEGGLYPSDAELPIVSVDAPPATYNGYRPSDVQAPLGEPGEPLPPFSERG